MTVKRFVTKRVEIEAVQFDGENFDELGKWTQGGFAARNPRNDFGEDDGFTAEVYDELHETWINVKAGQWIVRGAKGEYYPCDDETFHWKYEEVKPPSPERVERLSRRVQTDRVWNDEEIPPGPPVPPPPPPGMEWG